MTEVFEMPVWSYVEIDSGTITKSDDTSRVGQFRYFVNIVQRGDGSLGVWDGENHSDAIREANELASDLSLPVVDHSLGRRH